MIYVNQVGGQDELVFDGGSFATNADGELAVVAPDFEEGCFEIMVERTVRGLEVVPGVTATALSDVAAVWQALVLGVRDYVEKNGFPGVVLGLSGGIDSAVTLAVAVDALGADRVQAVMMPFKYTAEMSVADAGEQASIMGVEYDVISIESIYEAFMAGLTDSFTA
jgi:NAD+ synthase (glutamine-hydrolysing)